MLSIVNEYDLVSRADSSYIRSLIDLYRSIYHLAPIQDNPENPDRTAPQALQVDVQVPVPTKQNPIEKSEQLIWPLPEPVYWHIGTIVTLMTELVDSDDEDGDLDDFLLLRAVTIPPEVFNNLLWCNIAVHKRLCYKERIDLLLEGRFNGRKEGW